MIQIDIGIALDSRAYQQQQIRTVQCESIDYETACVIFYRCRFIDGFSDPQQYHAMFAIPWHSITYLSRAIGPGKALPNYDSRETMLE